METQVPNFESPDSFDPTVALLVQQSIWSIFNSAASSLCHIILVRGTNYGSNPSAR